MDGAGRARDQFQKLHSPNLLAEDETLKTRNKMRQVMGGLPGTWQRSWLHFCQYVPSQGQRQEAQQKEVVFMERNTNERERLQSR